METVLCTAIVGLACGQKTFTAIVDFVAGQEAWFARFLDMANGTPSEDTHRRVFEAISPEQLGRVFSKWAALLKEGGAQEVIAIDGKTLRNSGSSSERALHLVSAWATENGLVLGQVATDEKSNEITAIPKLLETLDIMDAIVTIDAMGCQRIIAEEICTKGAHYLLAVKENQPTLLAEVKAVFAEFDADELSDGVMQVHEEIDKAHGRIETRRCSTTRNISSVRRAEQWPSLVSVCRVESVRTVKGATSTESRYYISSLPGDDAALMLHATRAHWGVENKLHWCLDVTFGEDKANIRLKNLRENFAVLRRIAMNAMRKLPTFKGNLAQAGRQAAFSLAVRETLLNSIL
jgi:predicted transposase YbfD/YdcC